MGEAWPNNAEMIFQDCFIPMKMWSARSTMGSASWAIYAVVKCLGGATILGVAVALYKKAVDWASIRVQGDKPLIEHDGIPRNSPRCAC